MHFPCERRLKAWYELPDELFAQCKVGVAWTTRQSARRILRRFERKMYACFILTDTSQHTLSSSLSLHHLALRSTQHCGLPRARNWPRIGKFSQGAQGHEATIFSMKLWRFASVHRAAFELLLRLKRSQVLKISNFTKTIFFSLLFYFSSSMRNHGIDGILFVIYLNKIE